jgi:hypothetical protein
VPLLGAQKKAVKFDRFLQNVSKKESKERTKIKLSSLLCKKSSNADYGMCTQLLRAVPRWRCTFVKTGASQLINNKNKSVAALEWLSGARAFVASEALRRPPQIAPDESTGSSRAIVARHNFMHKL